MLLLIIWWEENKHKTQRRWRRQRLLHSLVASQRHKRHFVETFSVFSLCLQKKKEEKKQGNIIRAAFSFLKNKHYLAMQMSCVWAQALGGRLTEARTRTHTHTTQAWHENTCPQHGLGLDIFPSTRSDSVHYCVLSVCACLCVSPIHTLRWFPHSLPLIGLSLIQTNWRPDLNGKHYSLLCGTVEDSLTISARNYITALPRSPLCLTLRLTLRLAPSLKVAVWLTGVY